MCNDRVLRVIPGVQSYDWGIPGGADDCLVADFAAGTPELASPRRADEPYAEVRPLWMGTHPALPSRIADARGAHPLLHEYLCARPALLGSDTVARFGINKQCTLPFLFKVLSINKALSIQAHPDKANAERLHAETPSMYKDDNHKPEMAIALRPFEGFCGFRPVREVLQFVECVPELREVLRVDDVMLAALRAAAGAQDELLAGRCGDADRARQCVHDALQRPFCALMRAERGRVEDAVARLAARYAAAPHGVEVDARIAELVARLDAQFPRDVGVLCTFFLNLVQLAPGEAIFLGANEPHAYISGNLLECMAASDNVVRAGLTPKARDVDVLVHMLTYQSTPAADQVLHAAPWTGESGAATSLLYEPPVPEFSVVLTTVDARSASRQRSVAGPSILLVVEGTGSLAWAEPADSQPSPGARDQRSPRARDGADGAACSSPQSLHPGSVFFLGAGTAIALRTASHLCVARAFVEAGAGGEGA
ncbi:mannose-6-phosphate isomerase [Malassezia sp. CBS 17886]|nr:mannose-6-phosphate isomerase [Malassezia sp. CBS 17886]